MGHVAFCFTYCRFCNTTLGKKGVFSRRKAPNKLSDLPFAHKVAEAGPMGGVGDGEKGVALPKAGIAKAQGHGLAYAVNLVQAGCVAIQGVCHVSGESVVAAGLCSLIFP